MTRSECERVVRCVCHTHDVMLRALDYNAETGCVRITCTTFDGEPLPMYLAGRVQQDTVDALPMCLAVGVW